MSNEVDFINSVLAEEDEPLNDSFRGSLNSNTVRVEEATYVATGGELRQAFNTTINSAQDCYFVGYFNLANYTRYSDTNYTFYSASGYLKHYNASGVLLETVAAVTDFTGHMYGPDDSSSRTYRSSCFITMSPGDYLILGYTPVNGTGSSLRQAALTGYWIFNN